MKYICPNNFKIVGRPCRDKRRWLNKGDEVIETGVTK